ncbi:hypothetical protein PITCH_A1020022 [uncultured Desulfobacterium sp.]|uniref:Uncharacterized protein n=1 Tax=uncultured Desulfobacterium sp. TaxID=201089 RepID=A0A445MQN2_9BACT|nr:hypothetical protein PITCH_A1020022 [uncultured Desulfobacterium sp.]
MGLNPSRRFGKNIVELNSNEIRGPSFLFSHELALKVVFVFWELSKLDARGFDFWRLLKIVES